MKKRNGERRKEKDKFGLWETEVGWNEGGECGRFKMVLGKRGGRARGKAGRGLKEDAFSRL